MSRWILGLLLAGLPGTVTPLAAQDSKPPELQTQRQTSGKKVVPPEEDKSFLSEEHTFNPLKSEKSVQTGDFYFRKGKYQGAAYRYQDATLWNDGNAEAWLKLAKAEEKLKDPQAARDAYTKYLAVAPDAKDATQIRKKLDKLK